MREAGIADFAELSRLSGLNPTQFSNWARGRSQPSRASLRKIAPMLNVTAVHLWIKAGLVDAAELELSAAPDMTIYPREFTDLLELYRDDRMTEAVRDDLRRTIGVVTSGIRGQLDRSATKPRKAR